MKVLTKLQCGEVSEAASAPVNGLAWVASQPVPGCIRKVCLSAEGVTVMRGTTTGEQLQVRIPLDQVLMLAEAAEPGIAPAPAAVAREAE